MKIFEKLIIMILNNLADKVRTEAHNYDRYCRNSNKDFNGGYMAALAIVVGFIEDAIREVTE